MDDTFAFERVVSLKSGQEQLGRLTEEHEVLRSKPSFGSSPMVLTDVTTGFPVASIHFVHRNVRCERQKTFITKRGGGEGESFQGVITVDKQTVALVVTNLLTGQEKIGVSIFKDKPSGPSLNKINLFEAGKSVEISTDFSVGDKELILDSDLSAAADGSVPDMTVKQDEEQAKKTGEATKGTYLYITVYPVAEKVSNCYSGLIKTKSDWTKAVWSCQELIVRPIVTLDRANSEWQERRRVSDPSYGFAGLPVEAFGIAFNPPAILPPREAEAATHGFWGGAAVSRGWGSGGGGGGGGARGGFGGGCGGFGGGGGGFSFSGGGGGGSGMPAFSDGFGGGGGNRTEGFGGGGFGAPSSGGGGGGFSAARFAVQPPRQAQGESRGNDESLGPPSPGFSPSSPSFSPPSEEEEEQLVSSAAYSFGAPIDAASELEDTAKAARLRHGQQGYVSSKTFDCEPLHDRRSAPVQLCLSVLAPRQVCFFPPKGKDAVGDALDLLKSHFASGDARFLATLERVYVVGDECAICLTEKPDIVISACGHKAVCNGCFPPIKESQKCPICRAHIVAALRQ